MAFTNKRSLASHKKMHKNKALSSGAAVDDADGEGVVDA
jgi:hypothetical protein